MKDIYQSGDMGLCPRRSDWKY